MRKKTPAIFLAILLLFSGCTADQTSYKLDKLVAHFPGFHGSVLLAQGGAVLLDDGYGAADKAKGLECTSDTKYAIGSLTEQFTAVAVMQLYAAGKLDIEDKLSKYLPGFSRGDEITLTNLLQHTSGIVDYLTDGWGAVNALPDSQLTQEGIIAVIKNKPAQSKVGTYHLSSSDYLILGFIVEKVSGLTYADYLQTNIFDPLGMTNTGVIGAGGQQGYTAAGYKVGDYKPIYDKNGTAVFSDLTYTKEKLEKIQFGGGCLYSTTGDLYLWEQSFFTEKLLPKWCLDRIFASPVIAAGSATYGFGWYVGSDPYLGKCMWYSGQTAGFAASIYRYPDKNTALIYLTNIDMSSTPGANGTIVVLNSSVTQMLAAN